MGQNCESPENNGIELNVQNLCWPVCCVSWFVDGEVAKERTVGAEDDRRSRIGVFVA